MDLGTRLLGTKLRQLVLSECDEAFAIIVTFSVGGSRDEPDANSKDILSWIHTTLRPKKPSILYHVRRFNGTTGEEIP